MLYLRLYVESFQRALRGVGKSPWTLVLPMVYAAISMVAAVLLAPLGMVGGFLLGIIADLCVSSSLYFVAQAVLGSPARPRELKQSFLEYFWPVVSVGFVIWIASTVLGYALAANPNGDKIQLAIFGVAGVLLNAVPEVIYQKTQVGGIAIISESVSFIQKHWIEWFIPNLVLGAAVFGIVMLTGRLALPFPLSIVVTGVLTGALGYFVTVFRGCLFHLLDTTSPYQLKMRYRKSA
jgi:hypothetical protein